MASWVGFRLYAVLLSLSLSCLVSLETANYFNNNAYKPLRGFLERGIANTTGHGPLPS